VRNFVQGRRSIAVVACIFALLLVSTAQLAHSCPADLRLASSPGDQNTASKDLYCTLCLTSLSAPTVASSAELQPAIVAEAAVPDAQSTSYQRLNSFLLQIRPPPVA
jgi:hypothetical protein